jgi:hypothetical protein
MTKSFNLGNRRVFIDCNRRDFPAIGIQFGGHGQGGWFLSLWRWEVWLRAA